MHSSVTSIPQARIQYSFFPCLKETPLKYLASIIMRFTLHLRSGIFPTKHANFNNSMHEQNPQNYFAE